MNRIYCLVFAFALAAFAGDGAGKQAYVLCAACHGPGGEGTKELEAPAIAGQERWYLETQIKAFRAGIRGVHPQDQPGQTMTPLVATLEDGEVSLVADYINRIKPQKHAATTIGGGDAKRGKALYATCGACHGPKAKGVQAMNAPNLTLQQDWYLYRQIQYYKKGIRGTDARDIYGAQMRPMAMTLNSEQDIKDVVAYIMSLAD